MKQNNLLDIDKNIKTHAADTIVPWPNPKQWVMDNGKNMLNLTHTLDKIYLTGIL